MLLCPCWEDRGLEHTSNLQTIKLPERFSRQSTLLLGFSVPLHSCYSTEWIYTLLADPRERDSMCVTTWSRRSQPDEICWSPANNLFRPMTDFLVAFDLLEFMLVYLSFMVSKQAFPTKLQTWSPTPLLQATIEIISSDLLQLPS